MSSQNNAVFLFPGQGSQAPGMGKYLYDNFDVAKQIFEEASDAISLDMKKLCFESDEKHLALTENTQPALLTVSVATALVLEAEFLKADITAGHSIGEYASMVLAEAMSFSDAVRAVRFRGQSMQSAVPVGQGGMTAALGLNEEQVKFLCRWCEEKSGYQPVSPANFNCEGQIVISGNLNALNWLKDHFKPEIFLENNISGEVKRAKLIPLQVSAPFHCSMMKPAEEKMRIFFKDIMFRDSQIPIIQNYHANPVTAANELKENLILQVSAPVLWTQSMLKLKTQKKTEGYEQVNAIECGNGSVLKGLLKKIDSDFFTVYSTNSLDDLKQLASLQNA